MRRPLRCGSGFLMMGTRAACSRGKRSRAPEERGALHQSNHTQAMHTPESTRTENLQYVAAGVLTAVVAHALLCIATLPALMASPAIGAVAIGFKAAKVLWTLAGIAAASFVGYQASFFFGARSHAKARLAAIGALILPLIATNGVITAFALLPAGAIAFAILRQPQFRALFPDGEAAESGSYSRTSEVPEMPQSAGRQPAWPVAG